MPSVRLALDERRSLAVARARERALGGLIDRQHVVAVDRDAFEAVTLRPVRHVIDRHALFDRHGIGVKIVLADEDDRQPLDAREVQRLVEITGVARALAEVRDDDVVGLFHLEGEPQAGGDRQVGAKHAGVAENPELVDAAVERRVAALGQPGSLREHLRHHHARLDAFHQKRAEVAMQRADEVFPPQPEAGADDDRFLADAGVDAAPHLALAHQNAEALVKRADQLEPIEHVEELLGRQLELRALDGRHWRSSNQSVSLNEYRGTTAPVRARLVPLARQARDGPVAVRLAVRVPLQAGPRAAARAPAGRG